MANTFGYFKLCRRASYENDPYLKNKKVRFLLPSSAISVNPKNRNVLSVKSSCFRTMPEVASTNRYHLAVKLVHTPGIDKAAEIIEMLHSNFLHYARSVKIKLLTTSYWVIQVKCLSLQLSFSFFFDWCTLRKHDYFLRVY